MSGEPGAPADRETVGRDLIGGEAAGPTREQRPGTADSTTPAGASAMPPTAGWSSPDIATDGPRGPDAPAGTEAAPRRGLGDEEATEPLGASEGWDRLPPPVFESGRVVFGKYRLLEKIGIGGMGEVWKVQNVELDRTSALKLIKPEIAQNDSGWIRFQREARLMAKLNHPGAVAVYDFRRAHSMGYIEMEFIRGRSLDQVLKEAQGRPLPLDRVARILEQLCAVLQEAHGHRDEETGKPKPIIHRDLKPSNLMLLERGQPEAEVQLKVLDFGIAKMIEDDGSTELTGAHDIVGTPAYMSPEQIRGGFEGESEPRDIDPRSDIYSTGVVLYHLLTGTLPFSGNKMTLLASHLNSKPMEIREANPAAEVPAAVERVVMQCLEKDPDRRPRSARELAEAFRRAAGLEAGPAPAPRSAGLPWPAIAAAAVVLVAVGLVVLVRRSGGPSSVPDSAGTNPQPVAVASAAPGAASPVAKAEAEGALAIAKAADIAPAPLPRAAWMPAGFEAAPSAVDRESGLANEIKRKGDGSLFRLHKGGIYLPVGYEPDPAAESSGRWPSAIIRESDKARFVRIEGGVFLRGDPRPGAQPASDTWGNRLTRHYVRVGDFYIQDREVTNGEIVNYLDKHKAAEQELETWRRWYGKLREVFHLKEDEARFLPAASISPRAASRYAAMVGGFLPTEAQWEFAAKSRKNDPRFVWGQELPRRGDGRANLDNIEGSPAVARTFDKDKTKQGVFDMTGNVREICADAYVPYDKLDLAANGEDRPLIDRRVAIAPESPGADRIKVVVRGGSFQDAPSKAMTFVRDRLGIDETANYIGFRVVIECPSRDEDTGGTQGGR